MRSQTAHLHSYFWILWVFSADPRGKHPCSHPPPGSCTWWLPPSSDVCLRAADSQVHTTPNCILDILPLRQWSACWGVHWSVNQCASLHLAFIIPHLEWPGLTKELWNSKQGHSQFECLVVRRSKVRSHGGTPCSASRLSVNVISIKGITIHWSWQQSYPIFKIKYCTYFYTFSSLYFHCIVMKHHRTLNPILHLFSRCFYPKQHIQSRPKVLLQECTKLIIANYLIPCELIKVSNGFN